MNILYVTTISLTMNSFFKPHIELLVREGHHVDIACNGKELALDGLYSELGCGFHQIDFSRSPLSPQNVRAYGQLKQVIANGQYDVVHCHTPNAAAVTRLVCRKFRRKTGLKVFYTAHGFHFYKGAPKRNWMLYYPVEKFCSRFTDKLITINREDHELANRKFKAKEVCYIPGVGIDLSRFEAVQVDRAAKRRELCVPEDALLLISVGELNEGKNHRVILQAMAEIGDEHLHYLIVGKGDSLQALQAYAEEHRMAERVHFLGYRKDVAELYKISDICCFPSVREGLPVALMEAMACGVPVVCSRIRGNTDLIGEDGGFLADPHDAKAFASAIAKLIREEDLRVKFSRTNLEKVAYFSKESVLKQVLALYGS